MGKNISFWISVAAVLISISAISLSAIRATPYEIDFLILIIGVLTFLVAVLAVFLGYNYFMFERKIKEFVGIQLAELRSKIKKDIKRVENDSVKIANGHMFLYNLRIIYCLHDTGNTEYANMIVEFLKYTIEDYRESDVNSLVVNLVNAAERVMSPSILKNVDRYKLKQFKKEFMTLSLKDDRVAGILEMIDLNSSTP